MGLTGLHWGDDLGNLRYLYNGKTMTLDYRVTYTWAENQWEARTPEPVRRFDNVDDAKLWVEAMYAVRG